MKTYLAVLIAAVTLNCLVTTINGRTTSDALAIPYTDMLLPPLGDIQDNSNDAAEATLSLTTKTTADSITTTTTTTTTESSIINDVNNSLPELSIEALLPPIFEAKFEKEGENKNDNKQETTTDEATTTTTTTTTTTRKPTTVKPATTTTTTTSKPTKVEVPSLNLDAFLPPFLENEIDDTKNIQNIVNSISTTTTHKPLLDSTKTTKKSYYQQHQEAAHPKNYEKQQQQLKNLQLTTSESKNYNKQNKQQLTSKTVATSSNSLKADKQVAESIRQSQHAALPSHLHRNIEQQTTQHVVKQVALHERRPHQKNQKQNYSFDFYLGTTTPKPPKNGLPTITPFPHRLGR